MKIELKDPVAKAVDEAQKDDGPRPHIGCSQLGHHCDRWLWLSFRMAVIEQFEGRILRLFRRGQKEEATVVADLRAIGCDVRNTGTAQSRVDFGCHVSGSIDGVIESGLPGAEKTRHILEIKTHSKKSFDALEKDAVEKSKPMHWAQMQAYMLGTGIDRALYYAVCKDDDRIYTERVYLDKDAAQKIIARGQRLATSERMPEPVSVDPSWYQCKMCAAHLFCHGDRLTKEVNCRTCAHATPTCESAWTCARYDNAEIPFSAQKAGCECHTLHPDLVPWRMLESKDQWTAVYDIDGHAVANGEPCANSYSSKEIIANATACAHADQFIKDIRADGGQIVAPVASDGLEFDDVPF